jgi:hypothetical protein
MKLGLAAGEHVSHRLDPYRSLRLQPREFEQLLVGGLYVAPAQGGDDDERDHARNSCERDHNDKRQKMIGHPATLP